MSNDLQQLNEAYARELETWAEEFLLSRENYLRRKKIEASGELGDSFAFDMDASPSQDLVKLLIGFNDYGRIIDMRGISHDKWGRNAVSRVEDWIKAKGLLQKWIPKFMKKYKRKTIPHDILNRMAWGVLRNRTLAWRPKKWYNKSKSAAIGDLYNRTAAVTLDEGGDIIQRNMERISGKELAKTRARFRAYAKAKGR